MWFMTPFFTVLYTCFFLMLIITPTVSISLVFAQTSSDFQTGYSDGNQQGLSDRHNNVFRIGNICLNQSNSYCNGYLSGYLDGFFSTLPTNTHTTITIRESHQGKGGICHDNMTNCKPSPTPFPTPTPTPSPTPPPTPPPCKKVNGTCV
jgi:hypothetical protein